MNWFERMCRNAGLTVHNVMHPHDQTHEMKRTVEEQQIEENVTLRRTTIEEIQIKRSEKKP